MRRFPACRVNDSGFYLPTRGLLRRERKGGQRAGERKRERDGGKDGRTRGVRAIGRTRDFEGSDRQKRRIMEPKEGSREVRKGKEERRVKPASRYVYFPRHRNARVRPGPEKKTFKRGYKFINYRRERARPEDIIFSTAVIFDASAFHGGIIRSYERARRRSPRIHAERTAGCDRRLRRRDCEGRRREAMEKEGRTAVPEAEPYLESSGSQQDWK